MLQSRERLKLQRGSTDKLRCNESCFANALYLEGFVFTGFSSRDVQNMRHFDLLYKECLQARFDAYWGWNIGSAQGSLMMHHLQRPASHSIHEKRVCQASEGLPLPLQNLNEKLNLEFYPRHLERGVYFMFHASNNGQILVLRHATTSDFILKIKLNGLGYFVPIIIFLYNNSK